MFWIYKTKDMKELKVVVLFTQWAIKNEKSAILGKSYLLFMYIRGRLEMTSPP